MPLAGFLQLGASALNYMSGAQANETNIGLASRQNRYNIEQWMRENQYNLPANQVERLKAAGINPALAYASGSMMNESAASPQMTGGRVQAPYVSPVDLSQIRVNDALAEKAQSEARATEDANDRANELQPFSVQHTGKLISELSQNIKNLEESFNGIKLDNERKEIENMVASATMNEVVAMKRLEAHMKQDEASYYLQNLLADLGIKKSQDELNKAGANLDEAQAASARTMANLAQKYYNDAHERFEWERFCWNAEKKYVGANAHNDYVLKFYSARVGRKNAELLMKYGSPRQVLDLIRGGLGAINDGIDAYKKLQPNVSLGFSQKHGFGFGISND